MPHASVHAVVGTNQATSRWPLRRSVLRRLLSITLIGAWLRIGISIGAGLFARGLLLGVLFFLLLLAGKFALALFKRIVGLGQESVHIDVGSAAVYLSNDDPRAQVSAWAGATTRLRPVLQRAKHVLPGRQWMPCRHHAAAALAPAPGT